MEENKENIIGQIVFDEEAGFLIEWNKNEIKLDDPDKWEEIAYALDVCQSVMEELIVMHNLLRVMMEKGGNVTIH